MSKAVEKLEAALQRLIDGKTLIVQPPYRINNDAVALEAGLKRGSVNKQRPELAVFLSKSKKQSKFVLAKLLQRRLVLLKKRKKSR